VVVVAVSSFTYRLSSRIVVMMLANMVLQRFNRYKGRILASRESASEPTNMGYFVIQAMFLRLKA